MSSRLSALAAVALLAAAACDDPTAVRETLPVTVDRHEIYAMTGTPLNFPNAISIGNRTATRAEISEAAGVPFDIAFDLDRQGQVVLYPARSLVASPELVGAGSVRLQAYLPETAAFEDIVTAPTSGYRADSSLVVAVDRPVVFEIPLRSASPFDVQCSQHPIYRGKLVVDSVTAARQLFVRVALNANCGGRNLDTRSTT